MRNHEAMALQDSVTANNQLVIVYNTVDNLKRMNNEDNVTPQTADHSVGQKPSNKIPILTVIEKHNGVIKSGCSRSKVPKCDPCDDTLANKAIHSKTGPPEGHSQDESNEIGLVSQRQKNSPALIKKYEEQNPRYRIGKHVRLNPAVLWASQQQ